MDSKGYLREFIRMVNEAQVNLKEAVVTIMDAMWMETKLLADHNKVFLEADFVELIAQQNSKWRAFAKKCKFDQDGWIFYIMQRNPPLWERLKEHRKFQDLAVRVIEKLEALEVKRKQKEENNGNQS